MVNLTNQIHKKEIHEKEVLMMQTLVLQNLPVKENLVFPAMKDQVLAADLTDQIFLLLQEKAQEDLIQILEFAVKIAMMIILVILSAVLTQKENLMVLVFLLMKEKNLLVLVLEVLALADLNQEKMFLVQEVKVVFPEVADQIHHLQDHLAETQHQEKAAPQADLVLAAAALAENQDQVVQAAAIGKAISS